MQATCVFRLRSITAQTLLLTGLSWAFLKIQLQTYGAAQDYQFSFYQGPFTPSTTRLPARGAMTEPVGHHPWPAIWLRIRPVTALRDAGFPMGKQEMTLCIWDPGKVYSSLSTSRTLELHPVQHLKTLACSSLFLQKDKRAEMYKSHPETSWNSVWKRRTCLKLHLWWTQL